MIIDALSWRYACKRFDATKKISSDKLNIILHALNLAPTSMGMQLMKFLVIDNQAIKDELVQYSYNQQQVADCSHLLVLCRETGVTDEFIDEYVKRTATLRDYDIGSPKIKGFRRMLDSTTRMNASEQKNWMTNQVYIALGVLMTTCAIEKIDSCPMEGFIPHEYDRVLGLSSRGLSSVIVCPIGYRHEEDTYQELPKVRRDLTSIIEFI